MNKHQLDAHLLQIGRKMSAHANTAFAEREAIRTNPMYPESGKPQLLFRHAERTVAARHALANEGRQAIAQFRRANVLQGPLPHAPDDPARASYLSAWATLLPSLSPFELVAELTNANARQERDKLAIAAPYGRSVLAYRKPFLNDVRLAGVLAESEQVLHDAPENLASEEAAALADEAEHEIAYMEKLLGGDKPIESLTVHQQLGALPHLLPPDAGA